MILSQDFLQRFFRFLSSPDDIVAVLLFVLELLKVALDNAMSDLLKLLEFLNVATIFGILSALRKSGLIFILFLISDCIVH